PGYRHAPRPPGQTASDPFHPKDTENFIALAAPTYYRRRWWNPPDPFVRLAVDHLGREVMIKVVPTSSSEATIIGCLSSRPLRDHPGNHTIPVVSIQAHDTTFLVQACWGIELEVTKKSSCSLSFWAGTMLHQLLEGLTFMHEHGIIHGDIHRGNIVHNFEDARTVHDPCPVFEAFRRGPNYRLAFIDFGWSVEFRGDEPHLITCPGPSSSGGAPNSDDSFPPEMAAGLPFDPFPADVF
ncbi:hypothetical protein C8R46DRAFT_1308350, partial [Mycena filopes]